MEKGFAEEQLDAEPTFKPPDSFNFKWSRWFDQWNRTASSHRNYRSQNRNRGEEEAVVVGTYPSHRQIRVKLQNGSSKLNMIIFLCVC